MGAPPGGGLGRHVGTALALAAAIAAVMAAAALDRLVRPRRKDEESQEERSSEAQSGASSPTVIYAEGDEAHSIKSRVGNFKVSKLSRLVEDMATAVGSDVRFDVRANTAEAAEADEQEGTFETAEARQIALEQRAVVGALEILQGIRASTTHRRLPHFHAVDRQLDTICRHLDVISDNLADFWRYGREEPMAELLSLPLMQLAVCGGEAAIVPVPQSFLDGGVPAEDEPSPLARAAALLGVSEEDEKSIVETAYRTQARSMHRHGQCLDRDAFHALTDAYEQLTVRRGAASSPSAGRGSGGVGVEILAHYLLVGTDPGGSRYREYSRGILDAPHRERLMQKAEVVVNWGEVSGSMTGLGQG